MLNLLYQIQIRIHHKQTNNSCFSKTSFLPFFFYTQKTTVKSTKYACWICTDVKKGQKQGDREGGCHIHFSNLFLGCFLFLKVLYFHIYKKLLLVKAVLGSVIRVAGVRTTRLLAENQTYSNLAANKTLQPC